jgi:hypothetical protein
MVSSCFPTQSESSHEDLVAAESDPSPSTSSYSAIEPLPEPGTMVEEEIHPPEFLYRFKNDTFENFRNTSNCLDVQLGKKTSSVQIQPARNLLIETSPRPTLPPLPPDPPNHGVHREEVFDWSGKLSEAL